MKPNKVIVACAAAVVVSSFGIVEVSGTNEVNIPHFPRDQSQDLNEMNEELLPLDGMNEKLLPLDGMDEKLLPLDGMDEKLLPLDGMDEKLLPQVAEKKLTIAVMPHHEPLEVVTVKSTAIDGLIALLGDRHAQISASDQLCALLTTTHRELVTQHLVKKLIPLLSHRNTQYLAAWVLFRMVDIKRDLATQELIDEITPLLERPWSPFSSSVCLLLMTMLEAKPDLAKKELVDTLTSLLEHVDSEVQLTAIRVLSYVLKANHALAMPELANKVTHFLDHHDEYMRNYAAGILEIIRQQNNL